MLYQEAKKKELVKDLLPVHINKCRCDTYYWNWSSDLQDWVRGEKIPEHLKRMYDAPPMTKSNYK